jgi:hypothetical protein
MNFFILNLFLFISLWESEIDDFFFKKGANLDKKRNEFYINLALPLTISKVN